MGGSAVDSFLVFSKEIAADSSKVTLPVEVVPQFASHHELCILLLVVFFDEVLTSILAFLLIWIT